MHVADTRTPLPSHISYFPQLYYAVLKSQSFEKKICNTVFFIGRSEKRLISNTSNIDKPTKPYKVDLQLPFKCISRQHAVITYNFDYQKWQIRCLSKKNMIKVDEQRYVWGDKNVWLRNKAEISIGGEKMVFLEAKFPGGKGEEE